jgi:FkbM family methyltransferase
MSELLQQGELARLGRREAEARIRACVQTVAIEEGVVLARVLGRNKMFLSTRDLGLSCHLMLDGFWEMWLTLFFASILKPGMTVIDVGANMGYYTVLFGDMVGPGGRVEAIEPVPATAELLRKSVELNGLAPFTRVRQAAAAERGGERVYVHVPAGEPKNAHLVGEDWGGALPVETISIDALAQDMERLDLIKIDVEGSEEAVINGALEAFRRFSPKVLLEFNCRRYASPAAFLDLLEEHLGPARKLTYQGTLAPVDRETVLEPVEPDDILLYFDPRGET